MKIGVMSDSHGNRLAIEKALQYSGPVDMWLHCGDYSQDIDFLLQWTSVPTVAVAGNTDGWTQAKYDEFLEVMGKQIWLTHGHRYHVKQDLTELFYWGAHYEADLILFGHTHSAFMEKNAGRLYLNPGSVGYPHRGEKASIAVVEIAGNELTGKIITFDMP
ncbi:MAG: metallophosphoesterase [Sporomusaceae bacterium]|nr:metallophosphoesterase [Sporomusaceae bacterium]